jgi:signal peptidase I
MSFKVLSQSIVRLAQTVWGNPVAYTPNGGALVTIQGVFANAYVETEGIVSMKPTLRINLVDLLALPGKGDTVLVDTINYKVIESKIDGHGGSTLILQKA